MNLTLILICAALVAGFTFARPCYAAGEAADTIPLAGEWRFEIAGANEAAYARELPGKIRLPGTMDDAGLGPKNTKPPTLDGPYRLYDYTGPAWYQRDIEIPAAWQGKRLTLFLERCRWFTTVWLDDQPFGSQDSLIAPQVYDFEIRERKPYSQIKQGACRPLFSLPVGRSKKTRASRGREQKITVPNFLKRLLRKRQTRDALGLSLRGVGIDIGPLHSPVKVHPGLAKSYFVDRLTPDLLSSHYEEMVKEGLVKPHVVSDGGAELAFKPESLDFVIGSHLLEHMPDPLGALRCWYEVLRPGGALLLLVPDPSTCPDRHRAITPLEHLIADHEDPSPARDFQHYCDWAGFWNNCQESGIEDRARDLVARGYSIHYHVWSAGTLHELFACLREKYHCSWEGVVAPKAPTPEGFVGLWRKPCGARRFRPWRNASDPLRTSLFALLACPVCKSGLHPESARLLCVRCRKWYRILDDMPILLRSEAFPLNAPSTGK